MDESGAAVRRFYATYRPLARRYGLKMSSYTSLYDDGWIRIFRGEGAYKRQIIKVEEKNDVDLYNRATEMLTAWEKNEERRRRAAV